MRLDDLHARWYLPPVPVKICHKDYRINHLDILLDMLEGSKGYGRLLSFLYKYTRLIPERISFVFEKIDLSKIVFQLYNDMGSHLEEDGTSFDCGSGGTGFVKRQCRIFLYLLLKCKYPHKAALRILDFYDCKTGLEHGRLARFVLGDDWERMIYSGGIDKPDYKGWKPIANRMVRSHKGVEPCGMGFIDDVILR